MKHLTPKRRQSAPLLISRAPLSLDGRVEAGVSRSAVTNASASTGTLGIRLGFDRQSRCLGRAPFLLFLAMLLLLCSSNSRATSGGINRWTTNGPAGGVITALAIDHTSSSTLYAGNDNNGTLGGDGGVFKSTNAGGSWTAIHAGLPTGPVTALAIDPGTSATLYAATFFDGIFKSTNGGSNWNAINTGINREYNDYDTINALVIDPSAPTTLYASGFGYVYKSSNGGSSWSKVTDGLSGNVQALAIDTRAPATIYAGADGFFGFGVPGGVFKSSDGGRRWRGIGLTDHSVEALAIDPSETATLYAGTGSGVFKSTNGGGSWIDTGLHIWVNSLAIDPSTPATIYAGHYFGGVFKSINGGGSWTEMDASPRVSDRALVIDPSAPAKLYAGTRDGVFEYENLATCAPDPTTLCLNGGRFTVTTSWATPDGQSGSGHAVAVTGDTGYFTFFNPANVEMLVKVVNGCGFNSRFWTFAGGLTDVNVLMTVTDSQTGTVKTYTNPQGTPFQPIQDTNAFACGLGSTAAAGAPAAAASPAPPRLAPAVWESWDTGLAVRCLPDATTLCLNDSRYKVQTQWFTRDGASGAGHVIPLTGDTGAFWFFSSNNVEMVIKVLNGCGLNSRYWTFAGGLTNVNVLMTVTDTQTGATKTYTNPQGTPFQPIQDTSAFGTCP